MKKINIIFTVLSIVLLSSCEGFLDVKPSNSAPAETSITSAKDAAVVINGLMSKMASSNYYGRNFFMYGDAKGGDFAIRSQGRGLDALYVFNHSASSNSYSGFWSQMYHCILQANNLLVNIEKMETAGLGSTELSDYKGQALTARALIYFDMVRLYGKPYNMDKASYGVPLVLVPLDAAEQPTRSSVEEVYTQILKDLTDAEPLLSKSVKGGYLNYYANLAIQSRVYLTMDRFSDALSAAEEVITSPKYSLYANDKWVQSWSNEFGSESIFEIAMYLDENDLGSGSLGYYLLRLAKIKNAMGWFMASDYYLARLNEDPTDVRWGIMDYDESSNTRFGSCLKYSGVDLLGDKSSPSAVNVKVIRLSEIYLIAAEAALRQTTPDKVKASNYLNAIRKRSPGLALSTSSDVTLDMIIDEKSKELFAEGQRYFDMIRLNRSIEFNDEFIFPAVQITHRTKTIDRTFPKAILPLPVSETDANPAIKNQQNPGY
ncbi:MAG: RagB/SusD family nutrient uptake outer membrane protein [Bacteroidetes bacterium HGW-Bacteroidetes-10]|nr:MAG: RagB/SusD family nutrient uptake outer membrane protein [Bacteroidetes bacterium HGW-Bacteroidetes-10]